MPLEGIRMKEKNMLDPTISSLIKDSINKNESAAIDAYINGKPILVKSDGSIKVIENYELPTKWSKKDEYTQRPSNTSLTKYER